MHQKWTIDENGQDTSHYKAGRQHKDKKESQNDNLNTDRARGRKKEMERCSKDDLGVDYT